MAWNLRQDTSTPSWHFWILYSHRTKNRAVQAVPLPPPSPLNHPSFADVDIAYGDRNYSAVDTAHDSRELELASKINF